MTRTVKAWGENVVLHETPILKISRLSIVIGGYCSLHHHAAKDNTFIVEYGVLTIEDEDGGRVTLGPRAHHTIPPGRVHRFINLSPDPIQVLEVESLVGLSDADIYRQDEGGILGATR